MKIQDALSQNKAYWENELTRLLKLRDNHAAEARRINDEAVEAQKQINLYTKAEEILPTLDKQQVGDVNVKVDD